MKRTIPALATAVAIAALGLPASAAAEAQPGHTLLSTFDVLWAVDVSYSHKSVFEKPASGGAQATFRLSGSLPAVTFEDAYLLEPATAPIDLSVKGDSLAWLDNPEGTSSRCIGDVAEAKGMAGLGRLGQAMTGYAIWFAPVAGVSFKTACFTDDGEEDEGTTRVGTVAGGPGTPAELFASMTPTVEQVDSPKWEMPVQLVSTGVRCPGWNPAYSTDCTLTIEGKVSFFRTSRVEEPDLLAPSAPPAATPVPPAPKPKPKKPKLDRPKLDRRNGKLRTSVTCEWNCEVGIGIFAHRKNGKPYVKPVRRRTFSVKGSGASTTVTVPLSKAQLGMLSKGSRATVHLSVTMDGETTSQRFRVPS